MTNEDWASIAKAVGLELLGEPKTETSSEVRWGTHGSWALNKEKGQFYSFELDQGGGTMWLLKHFDQNINETLKRFGFGDEGAMSNDIHFISPKKEAPSSPTPLKGGMTRDQFVELWLQASIKLKYSDDFAVLRFPEGHPRSKIKYAPFTKIDEKWHMKRPEGYLPLYVSAEKDRDKNKPILIVEGEKAAIAAEQIYAGQVACHHGGCKGWDKTDWSSIYGRQVYIYPDNDEAGLMFMQELRLHLRKNQCSVYNCDPHKILPKTGDLHEAIELKIFKQRYEEKNQDGKSYFVYPDSDKLEEYISGHAPRGQLTVVQASKLITQVDEPDWLIEGVVERQSLVSVFGAPKSGKSFVAIDLAASVSSGINFFDFPVKQKSSVLYVAGEGVRGIRKRCAVLNKTKSLAEAPFFITDRTLRINDDNDYKELLLEIELIVNNHGNLGLLVLDTFQRVFTGNENSSEDVGAFIAKLDKIIADYECCIMIVHHTGHGNSDRARGSSVIPASLDSEFKVEKDKNAPNDEMRIKFIQTLNKDSMNSANLAFKLVDDHVVVKGKKIHSAYLEKIEFNFDDDNGKQLNASAVKLLSRIEADNACIEDKDARKEHTFKTADYKGKIKNGRGNFLADSTIKTAITDLINANHIYDTDTKDGCAPLYQLTELRNQSEFDKSDMSDN